MFGTHYGDVQEQYNYSALIIQVHIYCSNVGMFCMSDSCSRVLCDCDMDAGYCTLHSACHPLIVVK